MPNFSAIGRMMKGTRARKPVTLPLAGSKFSVADDGFEGDSIKLDLVVLSPAERTQMLTNARAFAAERGVADPAEDDPLYEQGRILHTLMIVCVDKDSPEAAPMPFFDGGFEQIHDTKLLSSDHLAHLYEEYLLWEDEVSPRLKTVSEAEFLAGAIATAQGDMGFFLGMQPGTRWSCFRTLAELHVSSLMRKSTSGSDSSDETETGTTAN